MRVSLSIALIAIAVGALAFLYVRITKSPAVRQDESAGPQVSEKPVAEAEGKRVDAPPAVRPREGVPVAKSVPETTTESWDTTSLMVRRGEGIAPSKVEEAEAETLDIQKGMVEWNPPPVSSDTLDFIREGFAKWRESGRNEGAAADLRLALAGAMSREEMLAAAATLMKLGTGQDRLDAMWIVANEFNSPYNEEQLVRANIPDGDGTDGDEGGDSEILAEEERDAAETHDLVALVGSGFEDPDPEVRRAAYEAAMALSQERNDILMGQLLCSDSPASEDLRRQLMDELAGATDEESISLFLTAMQSPDAATAAAAKENLERIAGRTFEDALDAADWLEQMENAPAEPDAGEDAIFKENTNTKNPKTETGDAFQ